MLMDSLIEVNRVFRKVFDREDLLVTEHTTAADISGWDSLTHMSLIAAVEDHFKIVFTFEEIREFNNVGDLVKLINKKKVI